MQKKVMEWIRLNEMIRAGEHIIVGVSGGADSVCLLLILLELQAEYSLTLTVVHVNHGIRGEEGEADAHFTQELCKELAVSCRIVSCDIPRIVRDEKLSEEEAGRNARYQFMEKVRQELSAHKIAVAHHKDDNEETIMWNFIRGTGPRGLRGIPPVNGYVIRPLLPVSRGEIEEWLKKRGRTWRMDSSNLEDKYTRNKLRNQVIPYIKAEVCKGANPRFSQNAYMFGEIDEYLNIKADEWLKKNIRLLRGSWEEPKGIEILFSSLQKEHRALLRYVYRRILEKLAGSAKDLTAAHIDSLVRLPQKGVGKRLDLPYGLHARNGYESVFILCESDFLSQRSISMVESVFSYEKGQKIPESVCTKWFDYDKINGTVLLRTRQSGDVIQVLQNGKKKLKDYMIDAKIPRPLRDQIPVVAVGHEIVWVVGYRISEAFRVTDSTTAIIQIDIREDEQDVR